MSRFDVHIDRNVIVDNGVRIMRYEDGECGDFGYWIEDTVTGEKIENEKVVALLNSLYEENEQLQNRNQELYDKLQETVGRLGLLVGTEKRLKECKKENEQLRQTIEEMKSDERLYAREIVELNKTKNEMLNFKELGGDY